ncbi:MAG TPA: FliM/FliN family flagellar motor switch protein [Gaiellaceae bacterium]|jgi:flagellar motor switch protein FliN/FliY|nr:FliM/FliN family flagellar motor switch protein [Gaiellaceae bacterium]
MTSEEALLLLGESIADAVGDMLRGLAPEGVERGPVTLAAKAELALQGLPALGVISYASYQNGSPGGNVVVMGRRAGRHLGLLVQGGDPSTAGEGGPMTHDELDAIGEATTRLFDTGAGITAALLGEALELGPPKTRAYDSPGEALSGLDLASRATSVTYTFGGEAIRLVHLIPNALLIRMTGVFDDLAAAQTLQRFGDAASSTSVRSDTVREVTVNLRAELGRTRLSLIQASNLDTGAAVTLDRLVEDPVELFVNGQRFGAGELVSTGGRWAVRITEVTGVKAAQR